MRRSFFSLMMVLACAPQESPSETPKAPETAGSATVVGTVDGQQITAAELQNRVDAQVAQFRVAGRKVTANFEQNTRRAIFQFLVDQELVAQEGQRQGLAITDEELDQAIATFKDRFGSPAGFVKYLKTIQRTETEWREDHRSRLLRDRVLNKMVGEMVVEDKEVRAHFDKQPDRFLEKEQVRAAQILIPFEGATGPHGRLKAPHSATAISKETKAKTLKEALRIKAKASRPGVGFGQLARTEGKDHRAAAGGDLGWFPRGRQPKSVEDAIFAAKKDQVVGPIKSQFGYHILKLIDRRPEGKKSFEDVQQELHDELLRRKRGRARRGALSTLRAKAKIDIFDTSLKPNESQPTLPSVKKRP